MDWGKVEGVTTLQSAKQEVKSAKIGEELPPKCKNCTLEEVAVDGSSSDHKVDADASGKKIHIVKGRKLIVR